MPYRRQLTVCTLTLLFACGAAHNMRATEAPVDHAPLLQVSGRIQSIQGREITLRSGQKLDTSQMPYDPADQHGNPQLHVGDLIEAAGTFSKPPLAPNRISVVWVQEVYAADRR